MATKKKVSKTPRKTRKKASPRPGSPHRTTGEGGPPPPAETTPSRPGGTGNAAPLQPAVALIVSLLAPGLGLLLLQRRDRVKDGFLIFGLWFGYVTLAFFLSLFAVGICCWLPLPLLNLAAGIHSFDEVTLEQGGQPVLFQTSFRIFQE